MACFTIVHCNVIILFILFGPPPTAMDAILIIIVDSR